jgi:predicted dehydrogenase
MRFALLGDHPDGLDMARALVASGRHELATYTGQPAAAESLRRWALGVTSVRDMEEVLANPDIEAVIVASRLADRPAHLRRALQSERHVLCVHPADQTPDSAYEAALIQGDTRRVLLPLLPEALHPAFLRLAELIQAKEGPLGTFQLLQVERGLADGGVVETGTGEQKLTLPGWDVLRTLGGEVAEVLALAAGQEFVPDEPLLLTGSFARQGLFQEMFLPGPNEARWYLVAVGSYGRAELLFPTGWPGACRLVWQDEAGETREELWQTWNPWPALVQVFEEAAARSAARMDTSEQGVHTLRSPSLVTAPPHPSLSPEEREGNQITPLHLGGEGRVRGLTWQTAIRCLELDDAARRSLERRRISTLEYPEATEEVGFKGTMTLVGCGLLWISLLLLILSAWVSWLKWMIVPLLVIFLGLQLLRWVVPGGRRV